MKTFTAARRFSVEGTTYEKGDDVRLSAAQGNEFVDAGLVTESSTTASPSGSGTKKKASDAGA